MNLDRVTITGADDSVEPIDLFDIAKEFPFVEWAILFSGSRSGMPRYPSRAWIEKMVPAARRRLLAISAHLCGRYVRDAIVGHPSWWTEYPEVSMMFQRVQINTHGEKVSSLAAAFSQILDRDHEFILQHDGANNTLVEFLISLPENSNVVAFYDLSSGAGVLPKEGWGKPLCRYTGYAGGLSPENVAAQLERIQAVAGEARIWIDVETRVRTPDDEKLDLDLVRKFLKAAEPFVSPQFVARRPA